ncbi:extracellular solute-binding protein [Verminephrobacter aporrectodeae subsp. tuberculatae]|nr:extracellular solute-binding protein [Verminephrobacter aporrectodeae subsp. tuberculatae]MCW5291450.1 extracellular solute-binding protein [Verminephrobacter aporrectodeae subsp. tuberculatae]
MTDTSGKLVLQGLTWDHARGYDPLVACARRYGELTRGQVAIEWRKRSLHDFGAAPIDALARSFDLLVIDHPFMGQAQQTGCFRDLHELFERAALQAAMQAGVGASGSVYACAGQVFALPTDAAAQVASLRPDLLAALGMDTPRHWGDVTRLAKRARANGQSLAWAGTPTDAACTFLSLAANLGHPLQEGAQFLPAGVVAQVLLHLDWLRAHSQSACLEHNPIQTYEAMLASDTLVYCPLAFGYSNYARPGRAPRLRFAALAGPGPQPTHGGLLGGAGMAISSHSAAPRARAAADFMHWLHSAPVQCGLYLDSGGQPGHGAAWRDAHVNARAPDFFAATLPTLESACVRPRFAGFVGFVERAGACIHRCLRGEIDGAALYDALLRDYRETWAARNTPSPPTEPTP